MTKKEITQLSYEKLLALTNNDTKSMKPFINEFFKELPDSILIYQSLNLP